MIEIKSLSKQFGSTEVLKAISFSFDGKILGVCGSGKTTLLNIISGVIPCTEGEVLVSGDDETSVSTVVKNDVGYLIENSPMPSEMTPVDFLNFVGASKGISKQSLKKQIDTVLDIIKLTESKNVCIEHLNTFERKLLGVAQALLGNPGLVVLDNPFYDLTKAEKRTIRQLIKTIGELKTVIVSASTLSDFSDICDKIAYLSYGELLACEPIEILLPIVSAAEHDDEEEEYNEEEYNNEENEEEEDAE